MGSLTLTVVGCSPAWPNPGGAHSGYLLEGSGSLLLDCGPGVLARLGGPDGRPAVDAIVLTHFHLDHCGDLIPWVWASDHLARTSGRPPRPQLWLPPGGRKELSRIGGLFGTPEMFGRAFAIDEYVPGRAFDAAGHSVTAVRVPHYAAAAYGLRVNGSGPSLAYSGDSAPCEELVELAGGADLFLCEATLGPDDPDGDPRGHLSPVEAEAAFERSGAKRLLVTHRPLALPAPAGHALARDGLVVELT